MLVTIMPDSRSSSAQINLRLATSGSDASTRTGGRADGLVSVSRVAKKDLTGLSRSQFGTASTKLCGAIVGTIFVNL